MTPRLAVLGLLAALCLAAASAAPAVGEGRAQVTAPTGDDVVSEPARGSALIEGWLLGHRGPPTPPTAPIVPGAGTAAVTRWSVPVSGPLVVVNPFRPPPKKWLPGHRGVDLLGADQGPVTAVADGTVSYSGVIDGVGIVAVRHGPHLRSTYQPVGDRVPAGTQVSAGDRLGALEDGGHCLLVTCLHLGAVRGKDTYLDPMLFLRGWELALLPLD